MRKQDNSPPLNPFPLVQWLGTRIPGFRCVVQPELSSRFVETDMVVLKKEGLATTDFTRQMAPCLTAVTKINHPSHPCRSSAVDAVNPLAKSPHHFYPTSLNRAVRF